MAISGCFQGDLVTFIAVHPVFLVIQSQEYVRNAAPLQSTPTRRAFVIIMTAEMKNSSVNDADDQ